MSNNLLNLLKQFSNLCCLHAMPSLLRKPK